MSKKPTEKQDLNHSPCQPNTEPVAEPLGHKLMIEPPNSDEILNLRVKTKLTQTETADMLGLSSRQLVSAYERGVKRPTRQTWTLWLILANQHPYIETKPRKQ